MAAYMISYDLKSPTNNREKVEEDIKSLGAWCKYLTTTFLISTQSSLETVETKCISNLDSNDAMIISKIEKPISGWLSKEQWEWIKKYI